MNVAIPSNVASFTTDALVIESMHISGPKIASHVALYTKCRSNVRQFFCRYFDLLGQMLCFLVFSSWRAHAK